MVLLSDLYKSNKFNQFTQIFQSVPSRSRTGQKSFKYLKSGKIYKDISLFQLGGAESKAKTGAETGANPRKNIPISLSDLTLKEFLEKILGSINDETVEDYISDIESRYELAREKFPLLPELKNEQGIIYHAPFDTTIVTQLEYANRLLYYLKLSYRDYVYPCENNLEYDENSWGCDGVRVLYSPSAYRGATYGNLYRGRCLDCGGYMCHDCFQWKPATDDPYSKKCGFGCDHIAREEYDMRRQVLFLNRRDRLMDNYGIDGFNQRGFDRHGVPLGEYTFDNEIAEGFNQDGDEFDQDGFNQDGFNQDGFDQYWYDQNGFDKDGFNRLGYDRAKFDKDGFNPLGYDRAGLDKEDYRRLQLDQDVLDTEKDIQHRYDQDELDKRLNHLSFNDRKNKKHSKKKIYRKYRKGRKGRKGRKDPKDPKGRKDRKE